MHRWHGRTLCDPDSSYLASSFPTNFLAAGGVAPVRASHSDRYRAGSPERQAGEGPRSPVGVAARAAMEPAELIECAGWTKRKEASEVTGPSGRRWEARVAAAQRR